MRTTSPRYQLGQIVGYQGSVKGFDGVRFRVDAVVAVSGAQQARYHLAYEFGPAGEVILEGAHARSLTEAPALRNT